MSLFFHHAHHHKTRDWETNSEGVGVGGESHLLMHERLIHVEGEHRQLSVEQLLVQQLDRAEGHIASSRD